MVSNDLIDGFIPKNAVKLCNDCRRHILFTVTCKSYPQGIPYEVLVGDCPDFEPLEETEADKTEVCPTKSAER